jgi:hypothetical protein
MMGDFGKYKVQVKGILFWNDYIKDTYISTHDPILFDSIQECKEFIIERYREEQKEDRWWQWVEIERIKL